MSPLAFLAAFSLNLCGAEPPLATPTAQVHFIDVGQGDATLLVSPAGRSMLIDGGVDGMGTGRVIPLLRKLGLTRLDHMVATHWHPDHVGGLDEVIRGGWVPVAAWDRGDTNRPSYPEVTSYLAALGANRRSLTAGRVIDLGGGMSVRCLAVNGRVDGGPLVSFQGKSQEENGRSIALKIRFGGFDLWVGGDLTGGGSGTADVEGPAAAACGDVDIYQADHHGSDTSSSATLLYRLRPEVIYFSAGAGNPYGHPTAQVVGRSSTPGALRLLAGASAGAGAEGFLVTGTLSVETDGFRCLLTGAGGAWRQWLAVDDFPGTPATGLRVSEFHRRPGQAPDRLGEYIEFTHLGATSLDLYATRLVTDAFPGGCTLGVHLLQRPGTWTVVAGGGDPARNGGFLPDLTWPPASLSLRDGTGWVEVKPGERVDYAASFPGGFGRSACRLDLEAAPAASLFASATTLYGPADRGSPGMRNYGDRTDHGADLAVASPLLPGARIGFTLFAPGRTGSLYLAALSGGSLPGFDFGKIHVPLNPDAIFGAGLMIPGMVGLLPSSGRVDLVYTVPPDPWLRGSGAWGAVIVLDPYRGLAPTLVSPARFFRFP